MIAHVQAQAEAAAMPAAPKSQAPMIVAAVVLAATVAYLWFGNPAWLEPAPGTIAEPSATQLEHILRGVSPVIEAWTAKRGATPATLADVGLVGSPYEYVERGPTSYALSLRTTRTLVTLDVVAAPGAPVERVVHSQPVVP